MQMKNFYVLFLAFVSCACHAQEKPIRLIVRGDDMGYTHSGNLALMKCFREGIQKSIEVIVPSPWFPEAVKMLNETPGVDVGIHLAITSEWDNIKWRPVSTCPTITNPDGYFYPFIHPNASYPQQAIRDHPWDIADIEKEFRAQIILAMNKIKGITHISGHMGCTDINAEVRAMTKRLAKEFKIDIDLSEHGVQYVSYEGPKKTFAEKKESFVKMIGKLKPGNTYLFVDHPGLDNEELRAVKHIGYEDVAEDRQGVTSLWTDPEIKKLISDRKIQLIGYGGLKI
jgi:chitin disaccharide deacetylase